jgi:hypothetical protein
MLAPLNPGPASVGAYVPPPKKTGLSRGWRLTIMVVATLVCAGAALLGAIWAIFSPLVFDRHGNLLNPVAWLGFLLMITFWIVCILGPFAAWVAWSRKQEPLAWAAMAVPAGWCLVMMTVLQFVPK